MSSSFVCFLFLILILILLAWLPRGGFCVCTAQASTNDWSQVVLEPAELSPSADRSMFKVRQFSGLHWILLSTRPSWVSPDVYAAFHEAWGLI